jgi:phage replication-related protein YjqB (UPF0714/DUF867 family)
MVYTSWADLEKNEVEGETYAVEVQEERSNWAHVAPHGGNIELLSLELAKAVAAERRQNYAALNVLEEEDPNRLKMGERDYDAPWALDAMGRAMWGITYHSVGEPDGDDPAEFAYVAGLATEHRASIIAGFKALDVFARNFSKEGAADSAAALVNKTKEKKGVRIELSRALRDKLVASGDAGDTSQGYTQLWRDIIAMLAEVTGPADVYQSWKSLSANEVEGEDYEIRTAKRRSAWLHMAYHGGGMELLTAELAKAAADDRRQNLYVFAGIKDKHNDRLRIPGQKFNEPQCVEMVEAAEWTIAYRGVGAAADGDHAETVYLGGRDKGMHRDRIAAALRAAGFRVKTSARYPNSPDDSPEPAANIVNRNKNERGLQVDVTRTLRDKMSASGDAEDLSQGTTQVFTDFYKAVVAATGSADVYQSWEELAANETEGEDYRIEVTRRGSAYSHLAIHGGGMELVTMELARKVAEAGYQSYYALVGLKDEYNDRLRIPSTKFDEPQCLKIQREVDFSVSYHGVSDQSGDPDGGVIRVGGRQESHRDAVIAALKAQGLRVELARKVEGLRAESGGTEGEPDDHDSADNIVNKNRQEAGVQIELNRTMRDAMSKTGTATDLRQGLTEVASKFIAAVSSVAIDTDEHQSWASFAANEQEGRDYDLEYVRNPESNVAHIAIHGGATECVTTALAEQAAAGKGQNFYSMVPSGQRFPQRLRIPSTIFAEPTCVEMQDAVFFTFSYHGHADREGDPAGGRVRVGGMDFQYRDEVISELKAKGFDAVIGGVEWTASSIDHDSPDNITNENQQPGGVQLELNRTLRDRMSKSGNACDLSQGTTQVFTDFVSAIKSIANKPDAPERENADQKCIRYFINDFNLDQPRLGYKLLKGTEYAPSISPRLFNLPIPSWHGQVPMWHDPIDTMKVTFEIQITGRHASDLRQKWDDFVGLCGVGKFVPVRLERYRGIYLTTDTEYDPHDRNKSLGEYANARLESLSTPEFEAGNKQLTATAVFDVPVGVWRSHKLYYQYFTDGDAQRCVVAKVSSAPVYAITIRAETHPDLDTWSVVDSQSQTGVAWGLPAGTTLKGNQYIYADTNLMRAYVSPERTWPQSGETFGDFIARIDGRAVWSDFRYIRNGPLNLTCKVAWREGDDGEFGLHHTSGISIATIDKDGKTLNGLEVGVMARAARI